MSFVTQYGPIGVLRLINFMTEVTCICSCHCKKGFSLQKNLHYLLSSEMMITKKAVYSFIVIVIHHSPNRVYYCSIFRSLFPNMNSKNQSLAFIIKSILYSWNY